MALERVIVVAAGQYYDEWESVTVRQSMKEATMAFELETSEVMNPDHVPDWGMDPFVKWAFPPGTLITILSGGDGVPFQQLCTALVNEYRPSGTPTTHRVLITGRTRMQDFVDSSYFRETVESNITYCQLLQKWAAIYDVTIECTPDDNALIPLHQVRMGATLWQESQRVLQIFGKRLMGRPDGSAIVVGGSNISDGGGVLMQKFNIISMSAELSDPSLFNETYGYSQNAQTQDAQALALNPNVRPTRKRVVQAGHLTDQAGLQRFTEWQRDQAIGISVRARIQVPGFRKWTIEGDSSFKPGTDLWRAAELVYVWAPWLKIDCHMLIEEVEFHQDDKGGTTTTLTLVDPRTAGGSETPVPTATRCNSIDIWRVPF